MPPELRRSRKSVSIYPRSAPVYNVRAIMHGLHDLTGNDDKSLKGESLVCFNFRTINTIKQLTLYCDLLLRGSPSLFSCILFNCFFFFFFFGMRSIITKTDVHSMIHTSPLILPPTPPPRPQTLSLFHQYLINTILSLDFLIYTSRKAIKHWH